MGIASSKAGPAELKQLKRLERAKRKYDAGQAALATSRGKLEAALEALEELGARDIAHAEILRLRAARKEQFLVKDLSRILDEIEEELEHGGLG